MLLTAMSIGACAWFVLAYFTYGRKVEQWLGVDPERKPPAHTHADGMDYVPTPTPVLFGHHFSSIAGAGPIVGPVLAALWFGWIRHCCGFWLGRCSSARSTTMRR